MWGGAGVTIAMLKLNVFFYFISMSNCLLSLVCNFGGGVSVYIGLV